VENFLAMPQFKKIKFVSLVWILALLLGLIITAKYLFSNKTSSNKKTKTILVWNSQMRSELVVFGTGQDTFIDHGCPIHNCKLISYTKGLTSSLDSFDAILFNFNDEFYFDLFPEDTDTYIRKQHQRFIFFTQESPIALSKLYSFNDKKYINYFNWTMTYKKDSDVKLMYGKVTKKNIATYRQINDKLLHITNKTSKKKKLAAWMVSHCTTASKREAYVKELVKYIEVDIYSMPGFNCGLSINSSSSISLCEKDIISGSPSECYEMIEKTYKFYF
jgi:hypothetical protein